MKKVKSKVLLLILLTIIILFFILKDDFNGILSALLSSNPIYLILIFLVIILAEFIKGIALYIIIKNNKKNYKFKSAFSLAIKTNFFNGITPFSLGGQPFELYTLKKNDNIDYVTGTNILFKDFYAYQIALVLLATIFLIINYIFNIVAFDSVLSKLMLVGYLVNLAVALFLIYLPYTKGNMHKITSFFIGILGRLKIIKNKDKSIEKMDASIDKFKMQINDLKTNKKMIIKCILLYMLRFIPLGLATTLSFYAVDVYSVGFVKPIIIMLLIMTMAAFVPIPGASGGMEYGFIAMFSFIPSNTLKASMLLWRFATYYLLLIMGAVLIMFEKRK